MQAFDSIMQIDSFQPKQYHQLLDDKVVSFTQKIADFYTDPLDIFASPLAHFRYRCEFRFWHHSKGADYAIFAQGDNKNPILINEYPIASKKINQLMPILKKCILDKEILSEKLFQITFLTSSINQVLVTLIYHKPLDENWIKAANTLEKDLEIHLIGRSKGQKCILSQDFIEERFTVNNDIIDYQLFDGGFTQPNPYINQLMLNWTVSHCAQSETDLLELYCGNGNFTLALAKQFKQVLATEVSKSSIKNLADNLLLNNNQNIAFCRLSSEEFCQAFNQDRTFRRLKEKHIQLKDYAFSTVFVDPPRAGLDEKTLALIAQFDRIIYISCNPGTLVQNIHRLHKTHKIHKVAIFDQFPYTHHIESGVIFNKKN